MTPAHITERNQANAQHSTGPRTEEGKAASSQNAKKHGLSGKLILKSQAEIERFQKRITEITRFYKLSNPLAPTIIEALVTAEFRRTQAFAAEQNALVQLKLSVIDELDHDVSDEELDGLARIKDAQTTRLLPQLNRHYVAADRSWHKHYKLLQEMKAEEEAREREMAQLNAARASLKRRFGVPETPLQNEPSTNAAPAATTVIQQPQKS